MKTRLDALLLIGPTGSGKTPLGNYLERHGLAGRRCRHFDFGASLRHIAKEVSSGRIPDGLSQQDVEVILDSLATGKLLENETFYIAEAIFQAFVRKHTLTAQDLVVLNGLPRHGGQARDVDGLVNVRLVVFLDCPPSVVWERIRLNAGGDRTGRRDDSLDAVERKLEIFAQRTIPLLDHYRAQGVRIERIPIGLDTTPSQIHARLESMS